VRLDAVSLLTVYLVALFAIESRLVIGPLGAAGNPAHLVALAGLGWWIYHQVQRPEATEWGAQPVRRALLVLFLAFAASYVVAMVRPIDATEFSTANLGMLALLSFLGVALLANDGIPSIARFELFAGRLVFAAAALALLGVAQFIVNDPIIRSFQIPGLSASTPLGDLQSRSGFTRPSGTAMHPIEFGAVLTMILPVAITRARLRAGGRLRAWSPVIAIGLGVVVCSSRSALLCGLFGLAVLGAAWPRRTRLFSAIAVVLMLSFVAVVMPGMLGSLLRLFSRMDSDGSVLSRTDSYAIVFEFFTRNPVLGRGFSTFLPSYRILDNQYLLLLIEVGLLGLIAFLGVLATAARCARLTYRHGDDRGVQEYGQALLAGLAAAALGLAFFDGFNFPMSTGVFFLVIGLSGSLWRLVRVRDTRSSRSGSTEVFSR
jgi:O-antigen ligase